MVAIVLHEYLTTVSKLVVTDSSLEVVRPLSVRKLPLADIVSVQMGDTFNRGSRYPEVDIFVRGARKPIRVRDLGTDATHLYQALSQVVGPRASTMWPHTSNTR